MAKQKVTPREELARLPQFASDEGFSPDRFDFGADKYRVFPEEREIEIRKVLADCIRPSLRSVTFLDEPTSLDRFLDNAIRALAVYIQQCDSRPSFDRAKAGDALRNAIEAVCTARERLQSIAKWRELADFVETVFVRAGKTEQATRADKTRQQQILSERTLARELRLHDEPQEIFQKFSPQTLAVKLLQLEPVLMLAAERIKLQPGDHQRNEHIQRFVDEIAFAWICGTGQFPTYSKQSRRSRNPSPFAALLIAMNKTILPEHMRSRNDFRDYAQNSVKRMKQRFPNHIRGQSPL